MRIGVDEGGGEETFLDQALLAIEVVQHGVEEGGALADGAVNPDPFFGGDDQRDGVHRPRAFFAGGVAADVISDAVGLN